MFKSDKIKELEDRLSNQGQVIALMLESRVEIFKRLKVLETKIESMNDMDKILRGE